MIATEDIKDGDSLEKWLTEWPKENGLDEDAAQAVAVTIAHRAAMRVLPRWWAWSQTEDARKLDLTALPILRSNIISGVAGKMSNLAVKKAASSAAVAAAADASSSSSSSSSPDAAAYATAYASDAAADASSSAYASSSPANAAARAARATSSSASASSASAAHAIWKYIRSDCESIAGGADLLSPPLWQTGENPFEDVWQEVVRKVKTPEWAFWIKWYLDALDGRPQNWPMLEQIALIDPEIWDEGAEAVAERIVEIEREYNKKAPAKSSAREIQKAVAMNLPAIPPQIDALIATIEAEIERLRGRNPEDDIEKVEVDRLRETFEAMRGALAGLSEKLPSDGKPSIEDAEEMEGLLALYGSEFKKWPKNNAADIVDSSCRLVLIGLSAGVLTAFGAHALAATAIAGIAFGGKKLVGIGRALNDVAAPGD